MRTPRNACMAHAVIVSHVACVFPTSLGPLSPCRSRRGRLLARTPTDTLISGCVPHTVASMMMEVTLTGFPLITKSVCQTHRGTRQSNHLQCISRSLPGNDNRWLTPPALTAVLHLSAQHQRPRHQRASSSPLAPVLVPLSTAVSVSRHRPESGSQSSTNASLRRPRRRPVPGALTLNVTCFINRNGKHLCHIYLPHTRPCTGGCARVSL